MDETTSREKILKSIRNALVSRNDNPYSNIDHESSVFHDSEDSLEVSFAEEFTRLGGQFVFCESESEAVTNLQHLMQANEWTAVYSPDKQLNEKFNTAGLQFQSVEAPNQQFTLVRADYLVARTASLVFNFTDSSIHHQLLDANTVVVWAYTSQLVEYLDTAFARMQRKAEHVAPELTTIISGLSVFNGVEAIPKRGLSGPQNLFLFLIDL